MGLTTNMIEQGINSKAAWGWRFSKLGVKLFQTGPRPALLAEKLGFFGIYHLISAKAWYACMAARIVLNNRSCGKAADKALDLLKLDETRVVDRARVAAAIQASAGNPKLAREHAGLIFAAEMMDRAVRGDTLVAHKFKTAAGAFDVRAALASFYSTLASRKMVDALRKPKGVHERAALAVTPNGVKVTVQDDTYAQVLLPLVDEAWKEIRTRLTRDAVDLFLL